MGEFIVHFKIPQILMGILLIASAVCFQSNSGSFRRKIYCTCICVMIVLVIVFTALSILGYGEQLEDYLIILIGTLVGYFIASLTEKG